MGKEAKNPIESMKQNPTFAPLAELVEIDAAVKTAAAQASIIASRLMMLSSGKDDDDNIPATEPLFDLYTFYAERAMAFSRAILDASQQSGIGELPSRMGEFTKATIERLGEMYANDPKFKAAFDDALEKRKEGKA